MEVKANASGISLTRLRAVDGLSLSDEEYEKFHPYKPKQRRMTKFEVACFLSHRKAWHEICQQENEHFAVFEDDIDFGSALAAILGDEGWISPDMDLIKLDKATRKRVQFGDSVTVLPGLQMRRLLSLHMGCGGYIISKSFASKLLERTQVFDVPIDHFLFNPSHQVLGQSEIWQSQPAVCIHQQFSDTPFLPAEAELSSLQASRKEQIRSHQKQAGTLKFLGRKIRKECARPFLSFYRFIKSGLAKISQNKPWQRVYFIRDL